MVAVVDQIIILEVQEEEEVVELVVLEKLKVQVRLIQQVL